MPKCEHQPPTRSSTRKASVECSQPPGRVLRDGSAGAETVVETRCAPRSLTVGAGRVFFTTYAWDNDRPAPGAVWSLALP